MLHTRYEYRNVCSLYRLFQKQLYFFMIQSRTFLTMISNSKLMDISDSILLILAWWGVPLLCIKPQNKKPILWHWACTTWPWPHFLLTFSLGFCMDNIFHFLSSFFDDETGSGSFCFISRKSCLFHMKMHSTLVSIKEFTKQTMRDRAMFWHDICIDM